MMNTVIKKTQSSISLVAYLFFRYQHSQDSNSRKTLVLMNDQIQAKLAWFVATGKSETCVAHRRNELREGSK